MKEPQSTVNTILDKTSLLIKIRCSKKSKTSIRTEDSGRFFDDYV